MKLAYLNEIFFHLIVHHVYSLTLLTIVQALLDQVEWGFQLCQTLFQVGPGAPHCVHLSQHVISLVLNFRLPELNVINAITETLTNVMLRPLCLFVNLQ